MAQAAAAETVREMAKAAAMLVAGIKILHNGIIRDWILYYPLGPWLLKKWRPDQFSSER